MRSRFHVSIFEGLPCEHIAFLVDRFVNLVDALQVTQLAARKMSRIAAPDITLIESHRGNGAVGIEKVFVLAMQRNGIMIHEDDLHSPLAVIPVRFQTNISRDKRFTTRMNSQTQQRTPELRDLVHNRQVHFICPCTVRTQSSRNVLFVASITNVGRSIDSENFLQNRVSKLPGFVCRVANAPIRF